MLDNQTRSKFKLPDEHLFKETPAPPRIVEQFKADFDAGAPSATRVKFSTGFYAAVSARRLGKVKLEGLARESRSLPFKAGYDLGWQWQPRLETTLEQQAKMDECFRLWIGTHTGTDTSINDEATAALAAQRGQVLDTTVEDRTGGAPGQPDGDFAPDVELPL